jgi:hypothetical protein
LRFQRRNTKEDPSIFHNSEATNVFLGTLFTAHFMFNFIYILILLQERGAYALQIPFWIWICVAVMAVVFAAIFAIIYVAVVRRTPTTTDTRTQGANVYIRVDSKEPNAAKSQNQGSILGRL